MDILVYLSKRLQQGKEVGLPGLGTFYKKKYPGKYDKEKQAFVPPGFSVQFTPEVKEEQNLAGYISSERNISVGSANYFIEKFVEEVKGKLNAFGEYQLGNLGRLHYNEVNEVNFDPSKEILAGSEYFGLPVLTETVSEPPHIETIEPDEVISDLQKTMPNHHQNDDVEHLHAETIEEEEHTNYLPIPEPETEILPQIENQAETEEHAEPLQNTIEADKTDEPSKTYFNLTEDTEEQPKEKKKRRSTAAVENTQANVNASQIDIPEKRPSLLWLKIINGIIVVIIVVALTYIFKPEWFHSAVGAEKNTAKPVDSTLKNLSTEKQIKDSIAKTDSILKANQIQQKTTDTVKKEIKKAIAATTVAPKKDSISFDVIVYASKSKLQASKFVAKMKAKGYDAKIANMSGPWSKVSIASFGTLEEALKQKDLLQKKLKGQGYYVQQVKNNTQP